MKKLFLLIFVTFISANTTFAQFGYSNSERALADIFSTSEIEIKIMSTLYEVAICFGALWTIMLFLLSFKVWRACDDIKAIRKGLDEQYYPNSTPKAKQYLNTI